MHTHALNCGKARTELIREGVLFFLLPPTLVCRKGRPHTGVDRTLRYCLVA